MNFAENGTSIGLFVVALVAVGAIFWTKYFSGELPEKFAFRTCQGKAWKEAYPNHSKEEIRTFLRLFTYSFAFRESEALKFAPSDKIYDVYETLYPKSGGIDALELETLAAKLEKRYQLRLEEVWSQELTLGELYRASRSGLLHVS